MAGITRADAGFTLVEVIVAFAVLSLTLVAATQIYSRGFLSFASANEEAAALQLAQARLNAVGVEIPLESGHLSGSLPDHRLTWELAIRPQDEILGERLIATRAFWVTATVSLLETRSRSKRQLSLTTLKLGKR
ncbi:MAG: prepilin-type N-terminal cleavage/methylation domain-containing protein [Hyphomicrobiaceae bacterium]|nr:MAG: prepilin-type N-terminal cleavage/methylation domain-containing protein [Hyphomicrobiaceae bacterium]